MTAGTAQCFLEGCHILDCSEDGIIGLEESAVHLTGSYVTGCQGPGIDMSDRSGARLKCSEVKGCCGGVWLWNSAICEAISSHIDGGSSYAVLLDADAYACGSSCTIHGPCHDSSEAPTPAHINRSPTHSRRASHEEPECQLSRAAAVVNPNPKPHSSSISAEAATAAAEANIKPKPRPGQLTHPQTISTYNCPIEKAAAVAAAERSSRPTLEEPLAKHPKTGTTGDDLIDHLQKQMWQQEPCSPFSSGSCSGSSLHSSADILGYYGALKGSGVHSEDGSGRSCGVVAGDVPAGVAGCYGKRLVEETMLVADAAAAAALFPPETGALLYEPSVY
eukprot:GHUV01047050.1.p1 GENE.GHUV01047050.1~~GHUV01047050.1.p1  ORF type:complete len:334 (+),score=83.52 GHUV01047050.1:293-1294(+)